MMKMQDLKLKVARFIIDPKTKILNFIKFMIFKANIKLMMN